MDNYYFIYIFTLR